MTRLNQQCTIVFVPIRDKFTDYVRTDRTVYMPTHAHAHTDTYIHVKRESVREKVYCDGKFAYV